MLRQGHRPLGVRRARDLRDDRRFGTILENVPCDPVTRLIDLDDDTLTENTRASYPLEFIANAMPDKKGGHPKNVILLTCERRA